MLPRVLASHPRENWNGTSDAEWTPDVDYSVGRQHVFHAFHSTVGFQETVQSPREYI